MRFNLYVGGVEHAYSPIGACSYNESLKAEFDALPQLPCLPLFSDKKMISELYKDDGFAFSDDRYHVFSAVCTQPKFDKAIGTNLLFALVPEDHARGSKRDKGLFSGRLNIFGVERLATLHSTGIKITINTTSNRQFMKLFFNSIQKHIRPINKLLNKKKVMFDMFSIDPKTAKVDTLSEKPKGVELIYTFEGKDHTLRTESHVVGIGHYIDFNLALKCDEEAVRELKTLPTFYLEKHPAFSKFKEMIWGVDKEEKSDTKK